MGHIVPFMLRPTLKLLNKIPDLGYPLTTDNGVIYCWNRHPLQLKYFISCLFIYTEGGMSFWQHIWAPYSSHGTIFVKVNSQIACKLPDLVCPISTGNGMLYYNERHSLLMKWSISFLKCMRQIGRTSGSIFELLIVHIMSYLQWLTLKLHTKCQIWGTLSVLKRRCYTAMIDVHCYWTVSYSSFDV